VIVVTKAIVLRSYVLTDRLGQALEFPANWVAVEVRQTGMVTRPAGCLEIALVRSLTAAAKKVEKRAAKAVVPPLFSPLHTAANSAGVESAKDGCCDHATRVSLRRVSAESLRRSRRAKT
jgi:hypothetical protein